MAKTNQTTALVPKVENKSPLMVLLEKARPSMAAVLPKGVALDRLIKLALVAASRSPRLAECEPQSILRAVMLSAQLGLEPSGPLGGVHMVPFRNGRTGKYEVTPIIDYRGLIDLARRSGQIVSIEAHVVHEKDRFRCAFGLAPVLEHEPFWDGEPGKMIAAYAVAHLRDGGVQAEVMTKAQIELNRSRSKTANDGPWITDYEEMARKTVVRRLVKYLPMSVEIKTALAAEDGTDEGILDGELLPMESPDVEQPKNAGDDLADKLSAKNGEKAQEEPKPKPKPPDVPADVATLQAELQKLVADGVVSVQEIADVKAEFGFGEDERVVESMDLAKLTAIASWARNQGKQ